MKEVKVSSLGKVKKLITNLLNMQLIKFGLVGVSNTFVDVAVFWISINILSINYMIAQVAGYACGIANSFMLNRIWTFRGAKTNTKSQLIKFVTINLISLSTTLIALRILVDYFEIYEMIAKLFVIVISQTVNFLGYKLWVFKGKKIDEAY
ncbi:GtrA family protein [Herbivorax sp. ANBcel31]|uniref:GtrA family protein n=1 Tax=Herbivorax sp. ANBcel31 TaxID=3069754 RepID=UPI0027AF7166|nr:GtrA family protein [Herbivorax sp. ANBcel31]MDQ2086788.1 GtrA family protein [Herbivorax sp. ANBcel31]